MTTETYTYIQKLAKSVSEYCGHNPPVTMEDMNDCLEKLHGEIREVDTLDVTAEGIVAKTEDDGFVIRLPKAMSEDNKILYAAKGIGHAFMHLSYNPAEPKVNWMFIDPEFFFTLDAAASDQAFEFAHAFLQNGKSKYKLSVEKEA